MRRDKPRSETDAREVVVPILISQPTRLWPQHRLDLIRQPRAIAELIRIVEVHRQQFLARTQRQADLSPNPVPWMVKPSLPRFFVAGAEPIGADQDDHDVARFDRHFDRARQIVPASNGRSVEEHIFDVIGIERIAQSLRLLCRVGLPVVDEDPPAHGECMLPAPG